MRSLAQKHLLRSCLIVIITLISYSVAYSQETDKDKEITVAINNVNNGNYKEAIPVLKKYAELKRLDDYNTLRVIVYLNLCYLSINKEAVNGLNLNLITDNYIAKHGISKNDILKSKNEMESLYFAGIINGNVGNYKKMVFYLASIKKHYDEKHLNGDEFYSNVLYALALGYNNISDYTSTIEVGQIALKLNFELFGEENEASLKILDLIYLGYYKNNEPQKTILYLQKRVLMGKELLGEKDPDYLASLNALGKVYSELGDYQKALEMYFRVVDLRKEVLGEKNYDYIESLGNLAFVYSKLGDYQKALEINLKVVELGKEVLGEKNKDYLISLNNLGSMYSDLGDYQKALEIKLKVVDSEKEVFGEKNPDYLMSLGNLAKEYSNLGDYKKALEIDLKVVELRKEILGEKHPDYLSSLNNLAQSYSDLGDYKKALEIDLKVVEIRKEVLGEKHPDYLTSLGNLGAIYSDLGDYQKGLDIDLRVVESEKEVLGEKHPDYINSLSNLAQSYAEIGDYYNALEIGLKVVELRKEVLGERHPDYLLSLSNLAVTFSEFGEYLNALEIKLKVVELRKEILGEKHPDYISSLSLLAVEYSHIGDYQKSLEINLRVVALTKEVLGEKHPDYLMSLNNLAADYIYLKEYEKSLEIYMKVVELRKEVLNEKHPDYLTSLSNLALVYSELGDYQKSLEINKKVVEIRKEVLGEKHPDYLLSMSNLASVYADSGEYQKALEINLKVIELRKEILGENSPLYLESLINLSVTEFHLFKFDSAFCHYSQMLDKSRERVIEYFSLITEYQRAQFWKKYSRYFDLYPMFFEKAAQTKPERASDAYDVALFSKGVLLNTTIDFDKLIAEKGTPEAIEKFEEQKLLKLEIQRLLEKPIAERYLNADSLENIAQQKETELVKLSKEYGDYTGNLKINWKDVQSNLGEKDVAIEFVEYPTLTDTIKYVALVLYKGWQYPRMISLFSKDQVEGYIKQDKDKIYSKYVGKELKKLIWSPLEQVVSPGEKVYFSPAGIIHQLAIENLPFDDSTTLGDRYQMYRLSSTKELALHKAESKNNIAALYGGLQYELPEEKMMAESQKYEKRETLYAMRGYNDTALRSGWKYLDGTKPEVDKISQLMKEKHYQVDEYTGETGNEESFKSLSGKKEGIIHIATHGFFLPVEESRKNLFIMQRMGDQQQERVIVDPMLRSGLIMAGGNKAWLGEKIPENIEDGVLTAREISRMDLRGTDLVVLSACETGLGDVSSEGVFGLQRSFKQAGVQTLVMSLWQVNDEATRYLMTEFYKGLLFGKEKRAAFLEAKLKCKEKYPEPRYWAAFIMLD
jgi:CHAT domain-containing protein